MGLEEANGPKSPEREIANPWVVCDVEKQEWAKDARSIELSE